jgi:hypothetical protein
MLVNVWLEECFGITLKDLQNDSRFYKKNGSEKKDITRKFYNIYAVTQKQYDEWETVVKKILYKKLGVSKAFFDKNWEMTCLNCAPSIKIK